jgi:hypothetical protein
MGHRAPSLLELVGAQGEGWRAFIGSAEHGESWAAPGVSIGIGGEASHDLNRIVAYGPASVGDGVAMAVAVLRRRSLPGVLYAASPVADEASEVAGDLGFVRAGHLPLMAVHAGDVVRAEGGHRTERVRDVEGVLAAGDILADAFELPVDWCQRLLGVGFAGRTDASVFLALHDGRPVAVAGSARIGDITGIYGVGTRQSHRRRGAAATAVTAAIEHGMEAGARWFGVFSPPAAEPFFAGLGFVPVDHAGVWVLESA